MNNITKALLEQAIVSAASKADVLTNLGIVPDRKYYPYLDKLAKDFNVTLPSSRSGFSNTIRKIPKDELLSLVGTYSSKKQILFHYGLPDSTHNYKILNSILEELNVTKFTTNAKGTANKQYKTAEHYLTKNSNIGSSKLKPKLIEENILKNECAICGLGPIWNNKPIALQLDHIDGDSTNNLIDNLRILCPNCHSQTDTFTSKNIKNNGLCRGGLLNKS